MRLVKITFAMRKIKEVGINCNLNQRRLFVSLLFILLPYQFTFSDNLLDPQGVEVADTSTILTYKAIYRYRYEREHYPFALKTNLYTLVGMTPEFNYKAITPNLAIEWLFDKDWSVVGTATFAYWNCGKRQEFWGVSGYGLEPRYWPWHSEYVDLYVGAFGLSGDYDIRQKESDGVVHPYTGKYWQAGLSLGFYFYLSDRWGAELGLRGGYLHTHPKVYDWEEPYTIKYFNHRTEDPRWGIMDVSVNVCYRFGK